MDDFNNFFDDQRNSQPEHTPVYHTPSPKHNNKLGPVGIICVVLAVVMSVVVLVNVIVLASLKQTIAEEYVSSRMLNEAFPFNLNFKAINFSCRIILYLGFYLALEV